MGAESQMASWFQLLEINMDTDTGGKKLIEFLSSDLRNLSNEAKKKYPQVKEACETGLVKVRNVLSDSRTSAEVVTRLRAMNQDVLHPLLLACGTHQPKLVQGALTAIQRLIASNALDLNSSSIVVNELWTLMESECELLKVLQTLTLLVTTNQLVTGQTLARCIVMCYRLNFSNDSTVINTASASVRQLVDHVFQRVDVEQSASNNTSVNKDSNSATVQGTEGSQHRGGTVVKKAPSSLRPAAQDAFMLFQDICILINEDAPQWLVGVGNTTRVLNLDLLENALSQHTKLFINDPEFVFLVKENVCPLVIKLFSPNLKFVQIGSQQHHRRDVDSPRQSSSDRLYFPVNMRLLRVVAVLLTKYNQVLITECEIFLSLILKLLEADKLSWQRALALEVLHKITSKWELLRAYCVNYDLRPSSTKLLETTINGLAALVQLSFTPVPGTNHTLADSSDQSNQDDGGAVGQPGFLYRNVWQPLCFILAPGAAKSLFLELVDKHEAPELPAGYCLSLAYTCMVDTTYGLQRALDTDGLQAESSKQLFSSVQNGVVGSLSLLLDASIDENITETLLKCASHMLCMSCSLQRTSVRDACVVTVCKTALPPNYIARLMTGNDSAAPVVGGHQKILSPQGSPQHDIGDQQQSSSAQTQVVAVGSACPMPNLPVSMQNTQVMLTSKNLQAMRQLISMAQVNGAQMQESWNLTMATLQHLVWMLGMRPMHTGGFRTSDSAAKGTERGDNSAQPVLTTAVMADLPVLSNMLHQLFESTSSLDDVALHHVIAALCKLSAESMSVAQQQPQREPSYFACAKLLQTGLANVHRLDTYWKPVTAHFVEVCNHPYGKLREWGAVSVVTLVQRAMHHVLNDTRMDVEQKRRLCITVLSSVCELCECANEDVRLRQIDAIQQLLHAHAPALTRDLWPMLIKCIGAPVCDKKFSFSDQLIKQSFAAVNLLVTDFIQLLSIDCVRQLVEVDSKFGAQSVELNISLSAVGQLWTISDHLFRSNAERPVSVELQSLWLVLYSCLGELSLDERPPVRKSATHTLLQTSTTHGSVFNKEYWQEMMLNVLFPVLTAVSKRMCSASTARIDQGTNQQATQSQSLLIHHSRDTQRKQWAETSTQTLAAVVKIVNAQRNLLRQINTFAQIWSTLLGFIESSSIGGDSEVSLAALRSLHEMVLGHAHAHTGHTTSQSSARKTSGPSKPTRGSTPPDLELKPLTVDVWMITWRIWLQIATELTTTAVRCSAQQQQNAAAAAGASGTVVTTEPGAADKRYAGIHQTHSTTPQHLTVLLTSFVSLFAKVNSVVEEDDLPRLFRALRGANALPIPIDQAPFIVPADNSTVTPTQQAIVDIVQVLYKEMTVSSRSRLRAKLPSLYLLLLDFVVCTCHAPSTPLAPKNNTNSSDWLVSQYVPFGELCLRLLLDFYGQTAHYKDIADSEVLTDIVKTLSIPLSLKYDCPSQSTWKQSASALMTVLRLGLPIARQNPQKHRNLWPEVASVFEKFLFPKSQPSVRLSPDERRRDEFVDCQVIELIRAELLPHVRSLPDEFVRRLVQILNDGSIAAHDGNDITAPDAHIHNRSEFARCCFESLLCMSQQQGKPDLVQSTSSRQQQQPAAIPSSDAGTTTAGNSAIGTLLERCKQVVTSYTTDERMSPGVPLAQHRVHQMRNVLSAVSTIISTAVEKHQAGNDSDTSAWLSDLIDLYPLIVDCCVCSDTSVRQAVIDALKSYKLLLQHSALLHNTVGVHNIRL